MTRLSFCALATLALAALFQLNKATKDPKTVCYYESWVHWRQGDGKMDPSEIDATLCTHIVYTYFGIDAASHELKWLDTYLMKDLHDIDKFVQAKGKAKAMIAVGGSTMSDQFSATAAEEHSRDAFVTSVVQFLSQYGFDGVMIDWYGVSQKDGPNLVALLNKFDEKFASTSFTIGISLPASVATLDNYDIPKINQYVDFMNIITLDYAGYWAKIVGHASSLPDQLKTMEEYHKRGAPRSKMLMAVPFFARTWNLVDIKKQDIGDYATGPGEKGTYTQAEGLLSYNELCVLIRGSPNSFSLVRDNVNTAVHAVYVHGSIAEFISFEDTKTLAEKAKNVTTEGYGGMVVYTLSNEDVHGLCGKKYPLLHAIVDNYNHDPIEEKPFTTIPPALHTTETVTDVAGVFKCHSVGKFRDPKYCFKYYVCEEGSFEGTFDETVKDCDRYQAWDDKEQKCVDASLVPGCVGVPSSNGTTTPLPH